MRKICVVTGSRADYGLLYGLLHEIRADSALRLQLIATGAHLAPEFGLTYRDIEQDGFTIDRKIELPLRDDTAVGATHAAGAAVAKLGECFGELSPDLVVLLGDRYEIFAAAAAAAISRIPIAHIHGGEQTIGAFDDCLRHAITKMSLLHFAAAEPYRQRIIQMGESPDRVFHVGAPALDNLARLNFLTREVLEEKVGLHLTSPVFLVTYHPVTLEDRTSERHVSGLLSALSSFPEARIVISHGNADPDNLALRRAFETFAAQNRSRAAVFPSLGTLTYLSLMRHADVVIGNSSSGIIEAPALKKATVNIGDRQRGRLMAPSIIQSDTDVESIRRAIERALSPGFQKSLSTITNPYEKKGASMTIKKIIKEFPLTGESLKKEFYTS